MRGWRLGGLLPVLALLLAGLLAWPPAVRADFRGSAVAPSLPLLFEQALAASRDPRAVVTRVGERRLHSPTHPKRHSPQRYASGR